MSVADRCDYEYQLKMQRRNGEELKEYIIKAEIVGEYSFYKFIDFLGLLIGTDIHTYNSPNCYLTDDELTECKNIIDGILAKRK